MNIVVVGMGYVGIPCAVLLADVPGFRVMGVQRRSERSGWKIECLNAGRCPFEGEEPGLAELIHRVAVEKGTFRVTDDYEVCKEADAILIDVQTPTDGDHVPHYDSLCEVSVQIGRHLRPGTLVVVESTVAPGTIQNVLQPILERESGLKGGQDFYLAFSYERVMPGKLLEYLTDFPRVVGGIDEESTRRAVELYRNIVKREITPTDVLTAEMAKVVENAYRDVNIAFANEVALACERMGVNVFEVRELVNARPDRHMHIPGAGVGGHCLPKDSWLLAHGLEIYGRRADRDTAGRTEGDIRISQSIARIIILAREINDGMPSHMVRLVEDALAEAGRELVRAKVVLLGAAYLENADDTRNTPAAMLAKLLLARGAEVVAHDPYVREADWRRALGEERPRDQGLGRTQEGEVSDLPAVPLINDLWKALEGADCVALVTRHGEYTTLDPWRLKGVMRTLVLVDGRNVFNPNKWVEAGFAVRMVGKG